MSVYQMNPPYGSFYYRFQHRGKKHNGVCEGCRTIVEARDFETKIKAACMRLGEQKTLNDLFTNCRDMIIQGNPIYLEKAYDLAMEKPRRRMPGENRERFKRNYWNDFVFFMHRMHPDVNVLQKVTRSHAEQFIGLIRKHGCFQSYFKQETGRGKYSNHTLNEIHSTCIQVFDLLKNDTGMPENPFKSIEKLIAESDSHEPYTFDELKKIFDHADEYLHPIFMIGLFSGLRLGDICTMKKSDIIFERHFIIRSQRKTGGEASVPMHDILERYLRAICDRYPDSEYLLPEHARQYLKNPSTISNRVRRFLENDLGIVSLKHVDGRKQAVNLKGIHSLRHTFCTIAGVVGIPEPVVRSIVGHMTPEMTKLYTRHIEEADKLRYIQLFGARVGEIPNLPVERKELPCSDSDRQFEEKLKEVIERGKERDRLVNIIMTMPLDDARKLLVDLLDKFPQSVSTVKYLGMA